MTECIFKFRNRLRTDGFLGQTLKNAYNMGAVRGSPIRAKDKFAVLAGVLLDIVQELQMAINSGSSKGFQKVLDNQLQGKHGL